MPQADLDAAPLVMIAFIHIQFKQSKICYDYPNHILKLWQGFGSAIFVSADVIVATIRISGHTIFKPPPIPFNPDRPQILIIAKAHI